MPLYEYECRACHHRFERIQQYSDPLVKKCPKCGRKRVEKLLSAPAVQFKGTGWYITDYQRKGSSSSLPDHGEGSKEKSDKSDKQEKSEKSGKSEKSSDEGKKSPSRETKKPLKKD